MATSTPVGSISLRGAAEVEDPKPGRTSALLLNLGGGLVQELKKASREKDGLRFVTGNTPKLRIGSKSIELTLSADEFRTELYASTAVKSHDFEFLGLVSHRAEVRSVGRPVSDETSGSDAALAALKNSLASYEQDRQANQTNITNSILPLPKSRGGAANKEKLGKKNNGMTAQVASPSLSAMGTTQLGQGPTSVPASEDEVRLHAMKLPVVHLLAIRPITFESISAKTHIPKTDLDQILQKSGKKIDGKWQLTDKGYRELDVWNFEYPHPDDRQSAIDHAVRAYDRMRLGKDEKLWQTLLPEEERDKGTVLSRLHLGAGHVNRGLTPSYQPSPAPHSAPVNDSRVASAANTPRLGAVTPRPNSSKGDVMKRLLSKDPKKAQVAEQAKEKKRKDREAAAASDREGGKPAKKQATQKTVSNAKSAEFVHSSNEGDGDETPITSQPRPTKVVTSVKREKRPAAAVGASSPDSSDAVTKTKIAKKPITHARTGSTTLQKTNSPALKGTKPIPAGRATPQTHGNLSAPGTQHKSQRSPQKHDSRPNVPSPLGAARPRVASDVSDRAAVGVQRMKSGGSDTPRGLGISNDISKPKVKTAAAATRVEDTEKPPESQQMKKQQQKSLTNGTNVKASATNGPKPEAGVKRKADDVASHDQTEMHAAKHRKRDSSSSQSHKSHTGSIAANNDTPRTSPEGVFDGSSSDSAASVIDSITYNQGVAVAERFQLYYPAYEKLHGELSASERRGESVPQSERDRLWTMHARLEQMKREMATASQREGE